MKWIHHYQLFLFDLDGLLVNTEELHYLAYKRMCSDRGFDLKWDFARYCRAAHYDAEGLKEQIYAEFPDLLSQEPSWDVLYAEKKKALVNLLHEGAVHMMPGAEELLKALQEASIRRCVVTHSPLEQVAIIREKNPVLDTIPVWITREHYTHPKPHPECYLFAIEKLRKEGNHVIGFEDTPRGMKSLLQTPAKPVLVSQVPYPEIPEFIEQGVRHFPDLASIPDDGL